MAQAETKIHFVKEFEYGKKLTAACGREFILTDLLRADDIRAARGVAGCNQRGRLTTKRSLVRCQKCENR